VSITRTHLRGSSSLRASSIPQIRRDDHLAAAWYAITPAKFTSQCTAITGGMWTLLPCALWAQQHLMVFTLSRFATITG
jgi:hypothetical protein